MIHEKEMTAPIASVGADAGQPLMYECYKLILTNGSTGYNDICIFRCISGRRRRYE